MSLKSLPALDMGWELVLRKRTGSNKNERHPVLRAQFFTSAQIEIFLDWNERTSASTPH
jgi:hypothetical protein